MAAHQLRSAGGAFSRARSAAGRLSLSAAITLWLAAAAGAALIIIHSAKRWDEKRDRQTWTSNVEWTVCTLLVS